MISFSARSKTTACSGVADASLGSEVIGVMANFVVISALAELLAIVAPAKVHPFATIYQPLERAHRAVELIGPFDRRHGPLVAEVVGRLAFEVVLLGRRVVGVDLYFPGVVLPEGRGVFAVQVVDICRRPRSCSRAYSRCRSQPMRWRMLMSLASISPRPTGWMSAAGE